MKIFVYFITLLVSLQTFSISSPSVRSDVLASLPSEISGLKKSHNITDLKKKFSKKIKKTDPDALYLHYFSDHNDITLGVENKRFDYAYIEVPSTVKVKFKDLFYRAYQQLSKEEQKSLMDPKSTSHEEGRYIEISLPGEAISFRFKNNDEKEVHSILFWNPGEKKP